MDCHPAFGLRAPERIDPNVSGKLVHLRECPDTPD